MSDPRNGFGQHFYRYLEIMYHCSFIVRFKHLVHTLVNAHTLYSEHSLRVGKYWILDSTIITVYAYYKFRI